MPPPIRNHDQNGPSSGRTVAKVYWENGMIQFIVGVLSIDDLLELIGPSGKAHTFVATGQSKDGCRVYQERPTVRSPRRLS